MKHIYHAEVLASLASGAKATLDFDVPNKEDGLDLIKTIAKDLGRTWEETTQENGQPWYSIVTHRADNFEVNVWVQPNLEPITVEDIKIHILHRIAELKAEEENVRIQELRDLLDWLERKK